MGGVNKILPAMLLTNHLSCWASCALLWEGHHLGPLHGHFTQLLLQLPQFSMPRVRKYPTLQPFVELGKDFSPSSHLVLLKVLQDLIQNFITILSSSSIIVVLQPFLKWTTALQEEDLIESSFLI